MHGKVLLRFAARAAVLAAAGLPPCVALSCSVVTVHPEYPAAAEQYVLYATVESYVELDRALCGESGECRASWGVKLGNVQSVYAPDRPKILVELYPFEMESDCKDYPSSRELVERALPLGAKVIVSAPRLPTDDRNDGVLRLTDSFFEYSIAKPVPDETDIGRAARSLWNYDYLHASSVDDRFELRKDLARLRVAKSNREVLDVMNRLVLYHGDPWKNFEPGYREGIIKQILFDYQIPQPDAAQLLDRSREVDLLESGGRQDPEVRRELERYARAGEPRAQLALGLQALDDDDYQRAIEWFAAADHAGYTVARAYIAIARLGLLENSEDDEESVVYRRLQVDAAAAVDRATTSARRLLKTKDPAGLVMIYALAAARPLEGVGNLRPLVCAGMGTVPVWSGWGPSWSWSPSPPGDLDCSDDQ